MNQESRLTKFGTISILTTAFVWIFEASVFGPAQTVIKAAFAGSTDVDIQIAMMIPMATATLVSIFAGILAKRYDKKNILIVGLLIYGCVGIMPIFVSSVKQLIILRAITGIGVGLSMPMTNAIIADHTYGSTRARLIGLATSMCSIANMAASVIIGFLMIYTWKATFYAFIIPLIIAVIVAIGVPKSPPKHSSENSEENKGKLSGIMYWYAAGMFLIWMISGYITINLAFWVMQEQIFAPQMIGIATVFIAFGTMVAGFIFPAASRILKSNYTAFFLALYGIGYLVLFVSHSLPVILLGNFLTGLAGQGALSTLIFSLVAVKSKSETEKDMAMGVMSGCTAISGVASIFVQQVIMAFNPVGLPPVRWLFLFGALTLVISAVVALFFKSKTSQEVPNLK